MKAAVGDLITPLEGTGLARQAGIPRTVHAWAVRTQAEIANWDDLSLEGKQERALHLFRESMDS